MCEDGADVEIGKSRWGEGNWGSARKKGWATPNRTEPRVVEVGATGSAIECFTWAFVGRPSIKLRKRRWVNTTGQIRR